MSGRPVRNVRKRRKTREYTFNDRIQARKQKHIREYIINAIILAVIIIILIVMSVRQNNTSTVCYKENSNVDYKVYLKENEFFESNYVKKDNQYIASLIDYITADFNYELEILEDNIEYDYKYRIEAEVDVLETSTDKSIYNFKEDIVAEKSFSNNSNTNAKIKEQVKIDYNKYNDLIKKFVSIYELNEAKSTLTINMCINIDGTSDKFTRNQDDEYVVSLEIPLTTKTVAINLNSNLVGCEETLMECESPKFCWIKLLIGFAVLIELILIINLIKYIVESRTPEDIYKLELNRILNNYGSYIQKINNILDLNKYQVIALYTFNDMLEIRDTIQEPILMYELKEKNKTYFMTPSKTNILYIFELKVND